MAKPVGWRGQPARHSLAAKGISTRRKLKNWSKAVDVKKGGLAGWSKDLPEAQRIGILRRLVAQDGYATVIRRLNYLINVGVDPMTDKVAKKDMATLQKLYGGGA